MEIYLTVVYRDGTSDYDMWDVDAVLTVEQFFGMAFSGCERERYMMLVNDYPVDWDYLLQPGDQVYIRPFRKLAPTK